MRTWTFRGLKRLALTSGPGLDHGGSEGNVIQLVLYGLTAHEHGNGVKRVDSFGPSHGGKNDVLARRT